MSWKRHFRIIRGQPSPSNQTPTNDRYGGSPATSSNFASILPLVYAGHPNRVQRYYQFSDMDADSDINAALDTIADFCTQSEEQAEEPFEVHYNSDPNDSEVKIIKTMLDRWIRLNNFRSRLWYMFRDAIKNGDAFFLRDPETQEWLWLDHFMVEMVKVDEEHGKKPEEYLVRGLDYNRQIKFGTKQADPTQYRTPYGMASVGSSRVAVGGVSSAPAAFSLAGAGVDPRMRNMMGTQAQQISVVDAQYVVHLSLSIGNDINWPFGQSILEPIFKTYKQKELLEDAIIIYRVQRAPERRVFYIDVGTMPPERAKRHIEAIKNDIHQRRIPNRTGQGGSILDAAFNPLCLSLDTQIPLLDGRQLSLEAIIDEQRDGKKNWVYSCDPITGEILPGNITWAGLTRKDAEVIRITLDNGETLTCTPDHKIPVLGKGFVEAQHLSTDDSLIAFNTRLKNIDRKKSNERTYTQVYDHHKKKWIYVHRMVAEFFRDRHEHEESTFLPKYADAPKNVIHHKDYNRYNNEPGNLAYMNFDDHVAYHVAERKAFWDNISQAEYDRIAGKISRGLKTYYSALSEEEKQRLSEFASERNKKWIAEKKENDPEGWVAWRAKVGKSCSEYIKGNPEVYERVKARLRTICPGWNNQKFQSTQKMLSIIAHAVQEHGGNRLRIAEMLRFNEDFLAEIRNANPIRPNGKSNINRDEITPPRLDKIIADFGFKNWKDFAKKAPLYNHRIVSIEPAGTMDVGTITVDGQERWNPHHTFAIGAGIFVKNSVQDDYFFAQGIEGRGSKVETLPGGDGNNSIIDLTFFSKKLARGLRVPTSYLSLGDDDQNSTVTFNDGKLGAAMIQEFRFSKYCMRLQSLLAPVFDKEFKRFLLKNGVEVEPSLFELRFSPPQSFTRYRQIELDSQRVQVYQGVAENKFLSQRFKLERYLGLTEEEIIENERLWSEENAEKLKKKTGSTPAENDMSAGLGSVGVRSGDEGLPPDLDMPPEDQNMDQTGTDQAPGGPGPAPPGGPIPAAAGAAPAAGPGGPGM